MNTSMIFSPGSSRPLYKWLRNMSFETGIPFRSARSSSIWYSFTLGGQAGRRSRPVVRRASPTGSVWPSTQLSAEIRFFADALRPGQLNAVHSSVRERDMAGSRCTRTFARSARRSVNNTVSIRNPSSSWTFTSHDVQPLYRGRRCISSIAVLAAMRRTSPSSSRSQPCRSRTRAC